MKAKVLNILLVLTSLLGYLQWPVNNHLFLFQAETDIVLKLIINPASVMHPFILLPVVGQVLLLITSLQQKPSKILTYIGICSLVILLGFIFIISLISINFKILVSSMPFLAVAFYTVVYLKKINSKTWL